MTTCTHYEGSKGPVEIATMARPYLASALSKLEYEWPDARGAEKAAMRARLEVLQADYLAYQASLADAGERA
jgi:hypothetical protein